LKLFKVYPLYYTIQFGENTILKKYTTCLGYKKNDVRYFGPSLSHRHSKIMLFIDFCQVLFRIIYVDIYFYYIDISIYNDYML